MVSPEPLSFIERTFNEIFEIKNKNIYNLHLYIFFHYEGGGLRGTYGSLIKRMGVRGKPLVSLSLRGTYGSLTTNQLKAFLL